MFVVLSVCACLMSVESATHTAHVISPPLLVVALSYLHLVTVCVCVCVARVCTVPLSLAAGNIGHRLHNAQALYKLCGFNILLVEYRGYGKSEGTPSERGEGWGRGEGF